MNRKPILIKIETMPLLLTVMLFTMTGCVAEKGLSESHQSRASESVTMSSEPDTSFWESTPSNSTTDETLWTDTIMNTDVLDEIENPSSLPPQQCEFRAVDEVQSIILDFLCAYYNTFVTLEPQNIADITVSNENTDSMAEFLRYQSAINRKNRLWFIQYDIVLQDYACTFGEDFAEACFCCQCRMRFAGHETDSVEGLNWQAHLRMTPEGWRISFIEPADWESSPSMYGAYRKKVDSIISDHPEYRENLWAITNLLVTQYE